MTFFLCPDNCLILRLRSWKNRPFICKWSRGNSMQNADTTQFFWGGSSIVYLYYYYYNTEIVSSPSSSRSSSTLNFPFRVDTFFVVFLCHLDFRLLCEQDFLGGKNDQKQAASLSHCCYSFPQQPQTAKARTGSRP